MGCCGSVEYNWQPGRTKNSDQDSDLNDDKEAAREGGQAMGSDGLGTAGGTEALPTSGVILGHWPVLTQQETHPSLPSIPLAGRSDAWTRRQCQVRLLESALMLGSAESRLTGSPCSPSPLPLLGLQPPWVHTHSSPCLFCLQRGRQMSTPSIRTCEEDFTPASALSNT